MSIIIENDPNDYYEFGIQSESFPKTKRLIIEEAHIKYHKFNFNNNKLLKLYKIVSSELSKAEKEQQINLLILEN